MYSDCFSVRDFDGTSDLHTGISNTSGKGLSSDVGQKGTFKFTNQSLFPHRKSFLCDFLFVSFITLNENKVSPVLVCVSHASVSPVWCRCGV